jgi:iron-sulfur cluster repair protein YtfE (RIC family)
LAPIQLTSQISPCVNSLPDLQIPMINTLVRCLQSEHEKLGEHILELALAANTLASEPGELTARERTLQAWDDIRRELWSHLQIEDELVLSWGDTHRAIAPALLDNLKIERQKMRSVLTTLPELTSSGGCALQNAGDCHRLALTLIALAQNLDSHVERYETEVLPAILRAVFHT